MTTITEDWAGKFALVNTVDDTALAVYPSRHYRTFPAAMKIPSGNIIAPFHSASLSEMRAVDIYPLVDDVPAHNPGWETATKSSLQDNINHYKQLYVITEKTPAEVVSAKRALINEIRNELELGGFIYDGNPYDSDIASLRRITGAVVNHYALKELSTLDPGNYNPMGGINWVDGNNVVQTLTAQQLLEMGVTSAAFIEQAFIASETHKGTLAAMLAGGATPQQLWEYDHTTGWPTGAGLGGAD